MKRAGFSMVKKQVSIASPLNEHVQKCQYSPNCKICRPFVKVIDNQVQLKEFQKEVCRVVEECKKKLKRYTEQLKQGFQPEEMESNKDLLQAVIDLQKFYEEIKTRETEINVTSKECLYEFVVVLQSCLIYFDENNQYGQALKQILPVGNYVWLNKNVNEKMLFEILHKQEEDLKRNKKVRVVDFYTCVDIELPENADNLDIQREEEFNLLVRNIVPNVFNYTEKQLRSKRSEYLRQPGKYKVIPMYKKLMSGTAPMKRYWIHSSLINLAIQNGWNEFTIRSHSLLKELAMMMIKERGEGMKV